MYVGALFYFRFPSIQFDSLISENQIIFVTTIAMIPYIYNKVGLTCEYCTSQRAQVVSAPSYFLRELPTERPVVVLDSSRSRMLTIVN